MDEKQPSKTSDILADRKTILKAIRFFYKGDQRYVSEAFRLAQGLVAACNLSPTRRNTRLIRWLNSEESRKEFVDQWAPGIAATTAKIVVQCIESGCETVLMVLAEFPPEFFEKFPDMSEEILKANSLAGIIADIEPLSANSPWMEHEKILRELDGGSRLMGYSTPDKILRDKFPWLVLPALRAIAGKPTPAGIFGLLVCLQFFILGKKQELGAARQLSANLAAEGFRAPGLCIEGWEHIGRTAGVENASFENKPIPAIKLYRSAFGLVDRARVHYKQSLISISPLRQDGTAPASELTKATHPEQPTNGKPLSDATKPIAQSMTKSEANAKAIELATENPEFVNGTQREWATAIDCSVGLVAKTTLWQKTMKRSGRGKKGQGRKPKKVSLTKAVEETVGNGKPDDALNKLIAEQESDYEPSPVDPKGRNPISRDDG